MLPSLRLFPQEVKRMNVSSVVLPFPVLVKSPNLMTLIRNVIEI